MGFRVRRENHFKCETLKSRKKHIKEETFVLPQQNKFSIYFALSAIMSKITVTLSDLAKMIDHSLLHPTMTDDEIRSGCLLAKQYDVATACVKPYSIPLAKQILSNTDVKICPVIGFPAGNSTTSIKMQEALEAVKLGGQEIDMVINIGKALSGEWEYVEHEIKMINDLVVGSGAILKVIFENDYLPDDKFKIRLCEICSKLKVAFVIMREYCRER